MVSDILPEDFPYEVAVPLHSLFVSHSRNSYLLIESIQNVTIVIRYSSSSTNVSGNLTAMLVVSNSKRGIVILFLGATLDLAATKATLYISSGIGKA
jgi:hypothetical protein